MDVGVAVSERMATDGNRHDHCQEESLSFSESRRTSKSMPSSSSSPDEDGSCQYEKLLMIKLHEALEQSKCEIDRRTVIEQSYGEFVNVFGSASSDDNDHKQNKNNDDDDVSTTTSGIKVLTNLLDVSLERINRDVMKNFQEDVFESSGLKEKLMKLETYNREKQRRKQIEQNEKQNSLRLCSVINSSSTYRTAEEIVRYEQHKLKQDELKELQSELAELEKQNTLLQESIDKENLVISSHKKNLL